VRGEIYDYPDRVNKGEEESSDPRKGFGFGFGNQKLTFLFFVRSFPIAISTFVA